MSSQRKFGIISVQGSAVGLLVNSIDISDSIEVATTQDEKGNIVDIIPYSPKTTASITGVLNSSAVV